jgi:hypothetical protein
MMISMSPALIRLWQIAGTATTKVGAFSATLRPTVSASSYVIGELRANGFDGQILLRLIQRLGRKAENSGYTTFNSNRSVRHSLPSDHVKKMTMAKFGGPRLLPKDESGTILGIVPSFAPGGEACGTC